MKIRRMLRSDLSSLVPLASQLGYPSSEHELLNRFEELEADDKTAMLVGAQKGKIIAFAHVHESTTLMTGRRAELNAIVVDKSVRGLGFGKLLMLAVEEWTRSRGIEKLRLGSRTTRTETHEFYKKIGFEIDKTWFVFAKQIDQTSVQ